MPSIPEGTRRAKADPAPGPLVKTRNVEGGVRILTLDHPPANTIGPRLLNDLAAACIAARDDDRVRAIVVTGEGGFFSGGVDLKTLASGEADSWNPATFGRNDGIFALWTLSKPTVAMLNGHAVAGGIILALACDFRIAARNDARIGINELAIGIAPPRGAYEIARLALTTEQFRVVGLGGELHDPDGARERGLVDAVVAPEDLENECIAKARTLGAHPREAYGFAKAMIQKDAIDAVLNEPADRIRALNRVWRSQESVRALLAHMRLV